MNREQIPTCRPQKGCEFSMHMRLEVVQYDMHGRSWARCLAQDTETGAWCGNRPSHGVFCPTHALDFQCNEMAQAATRLIRARLVLRDPAATTFQRWLAVIQARRADALRRYLLVAISGFEGTYLGVALAPEGLMWDGGNEFE